MGNNLTFILLQKQIDSLEVKYNEGLQRLKQALGKTAQAIPLKTFYTRNQKKKVAKYPTDSRIYEAGRCSRLSEVIIHFGTISFTVQDAKLD